MATQEIKFGKNGYNSDSFSVISKNSHGTNITHQEHVHRSGDVDARVLEPLRQYYIIDLLQLVARLPVKRRQGQQQGFLDCLVKLIWR